MRKWKQIIEQKARAHPLACFGCMLSWFLFVRSWSCVQHTEDLEMTRTRLAISTLQWCDLMKATFPSFYVLNQMIVIANQNCNVPSLSFWIASCMKRSFIFSYIYLDDYHVRFQRGHKLNAEDSSLSRRIYKYLHIWQTSARHYNHQWTFFS